MAPQPFPASQILVRRPPAQSHCPMTRAIEQVHQACADEIANTCQAPKPTPLPEDPLEAFFGIRRGGGSSSSIRQMSARSSSDPFAAMRMSMESDPFFRLTMTPPSASASQLSPFGSSALLDELFGGDFGGIDRLMDDMMHSALRFGTMTSAAGAGQGIPMQKTVIRVVNNSPAGNTEASTETAVAVADEQETEAATPADVAEAALEKMMNSFLGHVVSASASKASQATQVTEASEDEIKEEEEEADHPQAPRASDGDSQREVLSHDDADLIEASYGLDAFDPIAMARSIVQRGKAILQEEQEKEEAESEDDHGLRRHRRRLTAIEEGDGVTDPAVRRRLARRLTEVIPLVGLPTGITVIPLQEGGLRFLLREPENFQYQQHPRPAPVQHVGPTPRLMLGCGTDSCLWDLFDGRNAAMSSQCADSLSNVRATYAQLVQDRQRKEQEMVTTLLNDFGFGNSNERQVRTLDNTQSDLTTVSPVVFWLWLTFFVVSIYACLNAGGDDEEYDESPELEQEYVIISDGAESKEPLRINHIHFSSPCQGFSRPKKSQAAEEGVYTGIPVQVV